MTVVLLSCWYMETTDDLLIGARKFYYLARVAANPTTKLQLVALGDDYFRQAYELKHEQMIGPWPQSEMVLPPF